MSDSMTPRQREVTEVRNSDVLVAAAAGSGKTWVLIQRIMKLVMEDRVDVDQILMVTFTRAAASEMKTRLSRSLDEALDKALNDKDSDPSLVEYLKRQQSLIYQAHICTIDSFCGDVLRDNFYELDQDHRVDPGYRIVDPQEIYDLKRSVLDEVLEGYYRGSEKGFIHFVDSNATGSDDSRIEEIVFGLYDFENTHPDPEAFRNLVSENAGELRTWVTIMVRDAFLKVSEAADMCEGTGRYMDRFEWLRDRSGGSTMKEENLFTYGELIDFEYKEISGARDLLKGCLKELESDEPDDSRVKDIYDTVRTGLGKREPGKSGPGICLGIKYSFRVRKSDEGMPMSDNEHGGYPAQKIVKFMRDRYHNLIKDLREKFRLTGEEIEDIQNQCGRDVEVLMNVTADFAQEYEREKRSGGILEFSDVEQLANMILHETDESGKLTSTPSRAARDIREGFYEVLVDEYQDSNDLQESILTSVAPHMIMVGDMKQSIYGFRQARPELFIEKYLNYPEYEGSDSDKVKIILDRNFRSNAQVLSGVNLIFSRIMHRSVGNVEYDKNQSLACGSDYPEDNTDKDGGLYDNATEILTLHYSDGAGSDSSENDSESSDSSPDSGDSDDEDTDKAVMEAQMVGRRIRDMIAGPVPMLVMDSSASGTPLEKLRPARYSDVAILMRGLSDALAYAETLRNMGIPVHINKAGVLFETPEVMEIISFLKILDHSGDDISCAAVLKGFFGGMTSNDLAFISDVTSKNCKGFGDYVYRDFSKRPESEMYDTADSCFKSQSLYFRSVSLLRRLREDSAYRNEMESRYGGAGVDIGAIMDKLERLFTLYDRLAAMKRDTTVSDIISELINDGESSGRDYGSYVRRLPAGENRYANLELFISFAQSYEKNQYMGIFSFLRYIDSQKDNPDAQQAVPQAGSADAVNIYTIHKSKGLEYPIVIVARCDRSINDADSRSSFILNPVHGVSCKAVFPEKRMSRDSIQKQAMALEQKRDTRGEELRLLYVAMTRARDKLILSGCVKDPAEKPDSGSKSGAMDKKCEKAASQVLAEETAGTEKSEHYMYSELMKSRSYSDFLSLAMDRLRPEKTAEIEPDSDHPEIDQITEYVKYDEYTGHSSIIRTVSCHSVSVGSGDIPSDEGSETREAGEREGRGTDTGESRETEKDSEPVKDLRINAGGFVYPYEVSSRVRKKYSVSEIKEAAKERRLISTDAGEIEAPEDTIDAAADAPVNKGSGITGAERGTIVHSFMEHMDFDALSSGDDAVFTESFRKTCDFLKAQFNVTDEDIRRIISVKKIRLFLSSETGREMTAAYRSGLLYREQPFTVGFDLETIGHMLPSPLSREDLRMTASEDRVIIQGVIDAWYINDQGQAVVVDYKTDYLDTEDAFRDRYGAQLDLYSMTVSKLTDRRVAHEIIYSFHLDRAIEASGTERQTGRHS